jgi:hypothetical protein
MGCVCDVFSIFAVIGSVSRSEEFFRSLGHGCATVKRRAAVLQIHSSKLKLAGFQSERQAKEIIMEGEWDHLIIHS